MAGRVRTAVGPLYWAEGKLCCILGMMTTSQSLTGSRPQRGLGFGTAPVFLASISTILGAIMFLRFGYAVGNVGLLGAIAIILLGHLVTIPTALAIAEIATNRKVEGGGEYYIISRSFGRTIGATIGISLYLSQAISVAFYMIAFAEAFRPLAPWLEQVLRRPFDARLVSVPAIILLLVLILVRGANLGVKALWVVAAVLALSLALFFLGRSIDGSEARQIPLISQIPNPHPFMLVFAICFPAFTGITAGVGLSGDLRNPRKSIPVGILAATVVGMTIYVALVVKLAASASPEALATDQLVMSKIALWGPIIPIGLACATLSSAIGSILVSPRTLQALARDAFLPLPASNKFLAAGVGEGMEPRNATLVTSVLALFTVLLGNVDFVARVISMFFMVTYGALCAISFLEHFAARPSYRPSFRSKWYLSLVGALTCLLLMFQMDILYALLALVVMAVLYRMIRRTQPDHQDDLSAIFRGVMNQATRNMQIRLQKTRLQQETDWRPSVIMVNGRTFRRNAPLQLMTWICHHFGFGTYLHFIPGQLDAVTFERSLAVQQELLELGQKQFPGIFMDTIISPSMRSALAQSLQVPGISGMENNTALFEFSIHSDEAEIREACDGCLLAVSANMNCLVLRHGDHFFGNRDEIHIWLTWHDYNNASLMILLSYIILGHPDWKSTEIRVFAAYPHDQVQEETERLHQMILAGRIPVSPHNITLFATDAQVDFTRLVEEHSSKADLVVLGFTEERLRDRGKELLLRHPALRDVLFIYANQIVAIV